jgi:multiple sugar transport system permease protein
MTSSNNENNTLPTQSYLSHNYRLKRSHNKVYHLFLLIGSLVMLYPLLWMMAASFKLPNNIFNDVGLLSESYTLANYIRGWQGVSDITFSVFYKNSFMISGFSIIGTLLSCSMAAYAFARLKFKFRYILFAVMLVTMMLPTHVTLIPQYIIFHKLGWVNTFYPLIIPKFTAVDGFFIFLMIQFIRGLPSELDQAATVDGCGPVQIYLRIILPLSVPALATSAIFTFIWTWNDFFSNLLYLNTTSMYTVSLALRAFLDAEGQSLWGPLFAMSLVSLIPVFLIFIFFQKYLIEGITTGGVKG